MAILHLFTTCLSLLAYPLSALAAVSALSCPRNIEVVGVYIGERINNPAAAYSILQQAIERIKKQGIGRSFVLQYSGLGESQTSLGIFIDTRESDASLVAEQQAVVSWGKDGYIQSLKNSDVITGVPVWMARYEGSEPQPGPLGASLTVTTGITSSELPLTYDISPGTNSSAATAAPRRRAPPQRNSDGFCVSYHVDRGGSCDAIARAHDIKVVEILNFNKDKTWGFGTAARPYHTTTLICLSEGDQSLPAPAGGVECGPQVHGTLRPSDGTALADLNPPP